MEIDILISSALQSGPQILSGDEIVIVEGNPTLNQLHIDYIKKTYKQNVADFIAGKNRGWLLLGIFKNYDDAKEYCATIRDYFAPETESAAWKKQVVCMVAETISKIDEGSRQPLIYEAAKYLRIDDAGFTVFVNKSARNEHNTDNLINKFATLLTKQYVSIAFVVNTYARICGGPITATETI